MQINRYEKELINGEYGEEAAKLMEIMLKIGEINGAERLIEVSGVHLASTQILSISGEPGIKLLCKLADSGLKFRKITTTNPVSIDCENWEHYGISQEFAYTQKRGVEALRILGAIQTFTCTPYFDGFLPQLGEHLAWVETSAVIFANSFFGARTNREVDVAAIATAICGRTPYYGLHQEENRKAEILINIRTELNRASDYGALGHHVGKIVGDKIPVFSDNKNGRPSVESLVQLGASLATSAPIPLFHFKNITPEISQVRKEFGGKSIQEITIKKKDLEKAKEDLNHKNLTDIDYVALGCPQYSPEKVKYIAYLLDGEKINLETEVWICMSYTTKELLKREGEIRKIEQSGAKVVTDTCMVDCPAAWNFKNMATDSAKAAFYMAGHGVGVKFGTTKICLDAAIRGYWR